jgi:antitoxin ChpS
MPVSFTESYARAKYARLLIFAPQPPGAGAVRRQSLITTEELVARAAGCAAQTDKGTVAITEHVLHLLHMFDAGKLMAIMSKIRKQGGAAVLTIPPALLKLMELDVGAQVTLSVERGKLVAEPAATQRRRFSLSELLKGSAGMKRLTAEAAWAQEGEPVGREIG